jgi:Fe-S-cluster containining protein
VTNLFQIGPPRADSPCVKNACTFCCHETNMPLTLADLERLTALGYRREAFSEPDEDEGYLRLHNTDEGACYFLSPEGRCKVQGAKPEGCRFYPFIYDEDEDRVIRDGLCPYNESFVPPADVEARLRELIARLQREARTRAPVGRSQSE